MRKYNYQYSAYGKMRDRQTTEIEKTKQKAKKKEEDYYTWLVSGRQSFFNANKLSCLTCWYI